MFYRFLSSNIKLSVLLLSYTIGSGLLASTYTIADLKVLAKEKNSEEFIRHALDVRPSQRDSNWKKMLHDMAEHFVDDKIKRKQFDSRTYKKIAELSSWPALQKNEFFNSKRESYTLHHFRSCMKVDGKGCRDKIYRFWETIDGSIRRAEIGLKLHTLLSNSGSVKNEWDFISPATKSELGEFYCKKPQVKKVLEDRIKMKLAKAPSDTTLKLFMNEVAGEKCWNILYPSLKQTLQEDSPISFKESIYRMLVIRKQLTKLEEKVFLISYILSGPINGDIFNQSWSTLESLGQDYSERMKVLKELKSFDPLPDGLFNITNVKRRNYIIDLVYRNFPEYLDLYTRTCLDYYEGKRKFPYGNPTIHCKTLIKISKGTKWVDQGVKERLNKSLRY